MSLRPDWLPALAAFEAAARQQNFARAAEELHLTASAVSHHVRRLESRLGVALFQRHARGVALTAEGRRLADAASSAFSDVEGVLETLRQQPGEAQTVRITTLHSLVTAWLLPRMHRLTERHPALKLAIDTEIALTRFDQGGPDLGIRHGPGQWPGMTAHFLMPDWLFPVASPALIARHGLDRPGALNQVALIADLARQGWQDWLRAARIHEHGLIERFTFSDSTDALEAAALGLGVALAREKIVTPWLANGRLQRLPGPALEARWSYYVVYPEHRPLRAPARQLLGWLLEEASQEAAFGDIQR